MIRPSKTSGSADPNARAASPMIAKYTAMLPKHAIPNQAILLSK